MLKATFVFTHISLARVWDEAVEMLRARGVEARVAAQMSALDWDGFAAEEVARAGAVYLDLTRSLGNFDRLLDAARGVPLAVPGGIEAQAAMPEHDRAAAAAVRAYLRAGRAVDFAHAAL